MRLLPALLLLVGLLSPFAQEAAAAPRPRPVAQIQDSRRDGAPPPIPEPSRVVAIGSFQTAIGCPANDDPTCTLTDLTDDGGVWSGSFLLPPGQYDYRALATTPDGDVSLGEDGDPDGQDVSFTVTSPTGGAYFLYDTHTGEVSATAYDQELTVQIDALGVFALRPIENDEYEIFLTAPAGVYPYQIQANGEPIGTPDEINLGAGSRVHIVAGADGETIVKETVEVAALTVLKTDDAGQSLAGSCFALFASQDDIVNQACDADDGTDDGSTLLFFPDGVEPGTLELAETLVPEGQEAAEDQDVQVGPGGQTVTVQVAAGDGEPDDAGEGDEPTSTSDGRTIQDGDDPTESAAADDVVIDGGDDGDAGDDDGLTLRLETRDGATGETVEGACFRVETQTDEVCDDDDDASDGFVTLEGVDQGTYTVTETRPPDGYLSVGGFGLDIFAGGGEEYFIPHDADPVAPADDDDQTET
ncbi:MAG: hypothetical protein H0U40_04975, partial [Chloroflexia bacterium]|nr:hypothetical protein [Chloroflexia bacterium]